VPDFCRAWRQARCPVWRRKDSGVQVWRHNAVLLPGNEKKIAEVIRYLRWNHGMRSCVRPGGKPGVGRGLASESARLQGPSCSLDLRPAQPASLRSTRCSGESRAGRRGLTGPRSPNTAPGRTRLLRWPLPRRASFATIADSPRTRSSGQASAGYAAFKRHGAPRPANGYARPAVFSRPSGRAPRVGPRS